MDALIRHLPAKKYNEQKERAVSVDVKKSRLDAPMPNFLLEE